MQRADRFIHYVQWQHQTFNWKDYYQRGLLAVDELLIDHKMVLNIRADGEQGDFIELDGPRLKGKLQGGTKDALRVSFETAAKRRRPVAILLMKRNT